MYNGKFLIRFDDTNPNAECEEYEKEIMNDIIDCGFDMSNISYTSDSFEYLIEIATKMIKSHDAYVDSSPQEEISEQRNKLSESQCRNQTIEENVVITIEKEHLWPFI